MASLRLTGNNKEANTFVLKSERKKLKLLKLITIQQTMLQNQCETQRSPEILLVMEEWLLVSGTPASNVGAEEDSRGISKVESPFAEGSTNRSYY